MILGLAYQISLFDNCPVSSVTLVRLIRYADFETTIFCNDGLSGPLESTSSFFKFRY